VLADNLPAFQIELVREQVGDTKSLDATLGMLVGIGLLRPEEVSNIRRTVLLHKVYESVPIKLQLNEEEMALFAIHRYQFSGWTFAPGWPGIIPRRIRSPCIGYVSASTNRLETDDSDEYAGTSLIGKLGVEAAYEHQLHGKRGSANSGQCRRQAVDKQGDFTPHLNVRPPTAGDDLVLDWTSGAESGGNCTAATRAVVAPTQDGRCHRAGEHAGVRPECSCGVCRWPSTRCGGTIRHPLLNRALRGAYPRIDVKRCMRWPPEVRNIVAAANPILRRLLHLAGSSHQYRDDKKHGFLNMRQAIAQSCDVYFYRSPSGWASTDGRVHEGFRLRRIDRHDIPGEKAGCTRRLNGSGAPSSAG